MNTLVTDEKIGNHINYTCNLTNSFITFELKKDFIEFVNSELDYDNFKIILNMLKMAFEDLKKYNINKYRYTISTEEINYIDINKWNIVKRDDNFIELECDLNDAFYNVIEGFISND